VARFDVLLRFMRSHEDGAEYYRAFREQVEAGVGARAEDVSDDAAYGSAGAHALLLSAPGESHDDALALVRGLMRDAALSSRTCTAVSVIAWRPETAGAPR
jgi:hypothetical protein